jgi:hypothetical protein
MLTSSRQAELLELVRDQDNRGLMHDIVGKDRIGPIAARGAVPVLPQSGETEHRDDATPLLTAIGDPGVDIYGKRHRLAGRVDLSQNQPR